jgi:hypothetical protein
VLLHWLDYAALMIAVVLGCYFFAVRSRPSCSNFALFVLMMVCFSMAFRRARMPDSPYWIGPFLGIVSSVPTYLTLLLRDADNGTTVELYGQYGSFPTTSKTFPSNQGSEK